AGEAAVRLARAGGAFEHRILVGLHRRGLRQLVLLHIDMAGGAHAGAAAFGDDTVEPVKHRRLHDAGADGDVERRLLAVRVDIGHPRHRASVLAEPMAMSRVRYAIYWPRSSIFAGPRRQFPHPASGVYRVDHK